MGDDNLIRQLQGAAKALSGGTHGPFSKSLSVAASTAFGPEDYTHNLGLGTDYLVIGTIRDHSGSFDATWSYVPEDNRVRFYGANHRAGTADFDIKFVIVAA